EAVRPAFEDFVRGLVGPAASRLGWEPTAGESDLERKLRGELIAAMGVLGHDTDTIERCRAIVEDVLAGGSVDPEVATAALTVVARYADADTYETLWSAYRSAPNPLDQVRYLRSVAGVPVEELAVSTLVKVVDGDIRTQDGFWVSARLLTGKAGVAERRVPVGPGARGHARDDPSPGGGRDLRPVPARRRRRGAGVPVGAPSSRSGPLGAAEPGEAGRQRPTPPARDAGGQGVFLL